MEYRLYCELKVNDRQSGKLLAVSDGIYYVDEQDIELVLRAPVDEMANVIEHIRDSIGDWLKADLPESVCNGDVVYDLDVTYLSDEFDDEDEDEE